MPNKIGNLSGMERLGARVRRSRARQGYPAARTVRECAGQIDDLDARVRALEEFRNRPVVAIGAAIALAVAAKLAEVI